MIANYLSDETPVTLGLSAPWTTYFRMLKALFSGDPAVRVVFDPVCPEIRVLVEGQEKYEAIAELLPQQKSFGSVLLLISVVPANQNTVVADTKLTLIEKAFKGNSNVAFIKRADPQSMFENPFNYVAFKPEVVQFFNDDLSDVNGNCSTLYQDIAKEIIGDGAGVFFCTASAKASE